MELNTLKPALGSTRQKKRIGRGPGSGHGKTATKGHKGQKARSGGSIKAGFEGGQMPLQRRLPKRGFNPIDRVEYTLVNLSQLDVFAAGQVVTPVLMAENRIIKCARAKVKVLGDGSIDKALTVTACKFSKSAKEKILAAGGTIEEICGA